MINKLLGEINDVLKYTIIANKLIFSLNPEDKPGRIKSINLPDLSVETEANVASPVSSFLRTKQNLLCKNAESNGWLLNTSLEETSKIPTILKVGTNHFITDYIAVYQGSIKNRQFGVYSISTHELLWMSEKQKNLESLGDLIIGQTDFKIFRTTPNTGEIVWEQDLKSRYSDLSKVRGRVSLIGVSQGYLIVGLEQIDKLLALDIKTGSTQWEVDTFIKGLQIDTQKGILHHLLVNYAAYDLSTGAIVDNFRNNSYFKSAGIESQRSNYVVDGDYLITTDWRKGAIGAFNTATHSIDWVYQKAEISFPAANSIIYEAPYLLVQDNRGSLYIFERQATLSTRPNEISL